MNRGKFRQVFGPVFWRFGVGDVPTESARGLAQSKTLPRGPKVHGPNVCAKSERRLSMNSNEADLRTAESLVGCIADCQSAHCATPGAG